MIDLKPAPTAPSGAEPPSLMYSEAAAAAELLPAQLSRNAAMLDRLRSDLAASPAHTVLTLARGSSDNAATFIRYLIERRLGLVTASMAPSVGALYGAKVDLTGTLVLAISQSGRSPDLLGSMRKARQQGARIVALVNDATSPLALEADYFFDLGAGPELSVAATKSFTLSLTAGMMLVAALQDGGSKSDNLDRLPDQLAQAWALDWSAALEPLANAQSLYVVARGHALGVAQEFALKLKETCGIHAEAFSAAEVRHGPMVLVDAGFPVICLAQDDEARADVAALAEDFIARGACVMHSGLGIGNGIALPCLAADPLVSPILQLQSFYRMCEALSRLRGFDPDHPPHLNKVTRTL